MAATGGGRRPVSGVRQGPGNSSYGEGTARVHCDAAAVFSLGDRLRRPFPSLPNRKIFFMIYVSFSETSHSEMNTCGRSQWFGQ